MFLRRDKLSFISRLCTWIWPRRGWIRAGRYIAHRMTRMPGSSYSIAAGFACGAAISFTPFVGTHFLWATLLAWIIRGNIIAALIGTVVGNPWTFPFIWIWLYESGSWLIKERGEHAAQYPNFYSTFAQMMDALLRFDLEMLAQSAPPVIWPMFISSIPTAIIVWFLFYIPLKKIIDGYQHRRHKRQLSGGRK